MKTIKQIADELGVPKQRVYRFIKRECINEAHQSGSLMHYDEAAESLIKNAFSKTNHISEAHQSASSDTAVDALISTLQKELESKNATIDRLTAALEHTTASLEAAQQTAAAAQALHAGTLQKQIVGSHEEPEKEKKGWLSRLFR